jgi:hypothetical protein
MLTRTSLPFPILKVLADPAKEVFNIEYSDIKVLNYLTGEALAIPMAV